LSTPSIGTGSNWNPDPGTNNSLQSLTSLVGHVRSELAKVIVGQQELINLSLATIFCGGHALIEGVPGVAKTLTVKCIARVLNVGFRRVQCNSDLMPADIIGVNVFDAKTADFNLHKGPIFTELLLVDEINRMPPRTQAALLEAMEERQATIDGVSYPLPESFTVFATQNPVEFEGTYPLPEAQLDRFLIKITVDYPDLASELKILDEHNGGFDPRNVDSIEISSVGPESFAAARNAVAGIVVEPALMEYVAKIVRKSREWPAITLGASPRAAVAVLKVAKAFAAIEGREFIIPDDVKASALCTLRHRIVLNPEAELEGTTSDQALEQVIRTVEVPK
jgi:MoxR-like ATPase